MSEIIKQTNKDIEEKPEQPSALYRLEATIRWILDEWKWRLSYPISYLDFLIAGFTLMLSIVAAAIAVIGSILSVLYIGYTFGVISGIITALIVGTFIFSTLIYMMD